MTRDVLCNTRDLAVGPKRRADVPGPTCLRNTLRDRSASSARP